MVGESADHGAVAVTVVREAVDLHHRPVREVGEDRVGRVFDAVLALGAVAAPQRHVAAAQDGVSAHVIVCFHHQHGRPGLRGHDGRGQARGPRSDDDHIRRDFRVRLQSG